MIFRKFLMGQCNKIIHTKQPFTGFGMSTKHLYDDMYLYLKEIYLHTQESSKKGIDQMNGMPKIDSTT